MHLKLTGSIFEYLDQRLWSPDVLNIVLLWIYSRKTKSSHRPPNGLAWDGGPICKRNPPERSFQTTCESVVEAL